MRGSVPKRPAGQAQPGHPPNAVAAATRGTGRCTDNEVKVTNARVPEARAPPAEPEWKLRARAPLVRYTDICVAL